MGAPHRSFTNETKPEKTENLIKIDRETVPTKKDKIFSYRNQIPNQCMQEVNEAQNIP